MSNAAKPRCTALLMAVYTFLLALGAALPLAASYSEGIESRHVDAHIQGGAYQRRVEVVSDASSSIALDDSAAIDAIDVDAINGSERPGVSCGSPAPTAHHSRGS